MPHSAYDDWIEEYRRDAELYIQNHAGQPALKAFESAIVQTGIDRTRMVLCGRSEIDGYFTSGLQFMRWYGVTAYREALRVLLQLESIEMALKDKDLSVTQRSILRWCYVDQLSIEEITRCLHLLSDVRPFIDLEKGKQQIIDAYKQLCRVLLRRFRSKESEHSGRYVECYWIFPSPPALASRFDIRIEKGI